MRKDEMVARVRTLLQRAFELRFEGELHTRKVRAQAYVDGYMEALLDAGVVDADQQRQLVAEERARLATAKQDSGLAATG